MFGIELSISTRFQSVKILPYSLCTNIVSCNPTQGEVRIGKMDYTSESARRYGPMTRWHHQPCFLKLRDSLEYYGAATELPGFYALPADIQDQVKEEIKPMSVLILWYFSVAILWPPQLWAVFIVIINSFFFFTALCKFTNCQLKSL